MMAGALTLLAALAGGVLYRWRGGGWFSAPRAARLIGVAAGLTAPLWFVVPWWAALAAAAITVAACSKGHADWQDGGDGAPSSEWLNPFPECLTGRRNGPLHDAVGMALSGLSLTLPAGVTWFLVDPHWAAALVAISGLLKGAAYWLGWQIEKALRFPIFLGAEWGEIFTGVFLFAPIYAAWLL